MLSLTIHTDRFMPLSLLKRQNSCHINFTCPTCIGNLVIIYQVWAVEVLTNRIMRKQNTDLKIDGERWQKSALFYFLRRQKWQKPRDMLIKMLLRKRQILKAETGDTGMNKVSGDVRGPDWGSNVQNKVNEIGKNSQTQQGQRWQKERETAGTVSASNLHGK